MAWIWELISNPFFYGVSFVAKQLIEASAGGSTDSKTPQKVYDLIKQNSDEQLHLVRTEGQA